ncbi:PREDICTED: ras-like protein family member 10B [Priapulus caudatus]|uniref:Ras-like protein family member 10B n=1 Tax=Priapulus caudatus TaxID=37621 RepID=A0ABM1DYW1_PRICU|nr:PREDICTED: ras-like protein family member 10B [Priapulus caudatus]XP_014665132.1 PREDICTED: ras-like protein family member 10B [Priapulus caudatus]
MCPSSGMDLVKIVVLGAPGVGKSSIIRQFVYHDFTEGHAPTRHKHTYFPSVVINEHLYQIRIVDLPVIPYFPMTSLHEWTDFRFYGLRSATAYLLVFDLTQEQSFQYIKSIREQILASRNMHNVLIFVVGNKHDLGGAPRADTQRREVVNIVKKSWKCGYIECSARYNWHVVALFKELMKAIHYIDYGHKPTAVRIQGALRRNKCVIL